jgi:hypothetical protein
MFLQASVLDVGHCSSEMPCTSTHPHIKSNITFLLTSLLTPWSRVFLKKLSGFQLVKEFPPFYGTRRFTTAFTRVCHLTLSWARSIQSISPTFHFLKFHFSITLPSTHGYSKWSLSLKLPHQNPACTSPYSIRATCPAHLILLDLITRITFGEDILLHIYPTRCTSHRVYFIWQLLYMFRASLSPIFRSTKQL